MQRDPWLADFRGLRGRIGLYGGSFDPVHRGHLEVARSARRAHGLERVVFLPTARNPMKPRGPRASNADRAAMLRLALQDEPALFVSPLELERAGTSYTVETLRAIRAQVEPEAELYFVMGSDCLPDFPR
ncbi:MAG: nicotinate-nicotinamide nucleotide adenylyltransferase [Planctomycetes bacterium]|nr:nicotinate-nicotinamide nucleotide adenylyltransferase [Planctomycetota bacterium]